MQRRRFLGAALTSVAALSLPRSRLFAQCETRTDPNIEGPFFEPGAPFRTQLGDQLIVRGTVRDTQCRPMEDAVMEIWQTNADGVYDHGGTDFRARLRTDENGAYAFTTVYPGRYRVGPSFRPAHIHVKVHANGRPALTTQLYFAGDPYNDNDPWFRQSLVLTQPPPGCTYDPERLAESSFQFIV